MKVFLGLINDVTQGGEMSQVLDSPAFFFLF